MTSTLSGNLALAVVLLAVAGAPPTAEAQNRPDADTSGGLTGQQGDNEQDPKKKPAGNKVHDNAGQPAGQPGIINPPTNVQQRAKHPEKNLGATPTVPNGQPKLVAPSGDNAPGQNKKFNRHRDNSVPVINKAPPPPEQKPITAPNNAPPWQHKNKQPYQADDRVQPNTNKTYQPPKQDAGTVKKPWVAPPVLNADRDVVKETPHRLQDLQRQRVRKVEDGGKRVIIEEPGKRVIVKQDNRMVIQRDETERVRRVAPNARFEKRNGGTMSIVERPNGVKIISETDANGQLLRRYRRDASGREFIIIDNRRYGGRRKKDKFGRNIAIGAGIGLGVAAGAAILDSIVNVPPPRVRIPRDKYIVEYEDASEDDVYEALNAPPVDDYRDRYTLNEIRATHRLRERMRRVDLDDITFEFGSWEVDPSQYRKLERIARVMMRIIDRNPNEVFLIEGYTDAVGSREDNLSLSDRRAESVAVILSEEFRVPFENLTTQGYGEDYLKVQTLAPERLNRRVAARRITPLLARDDRSSGARGNGGYDDDRGGSGEPGGYDDSRDGGDGRGEPDDGPSGADYGPYDGGRDGR